MSVVAIRAALDTALDTLSPAIVTAKENVNFDAEAGVAATAPYQRVHLLLAQPDNAEISRRHVEQGIYQITLCYPLNTGPAAAATRAELIRATFYRGASFVAGGITVTIIRTPEIAPAMIEGDRYVVPVSIRFMAPVNT
jgi:hypothetical protein